MTWAAHFWDVERNPAQFPTAFDELYFRRWVIALHLRQRMTPAPA